MTECCYSNICSANRVAHEPFLSFLCVQTFKFDRFVDAKFYRGGQEVKYPLIAFGFLCPGKRMSTLQSKWFILNFLNSFNMELEEGSRAVMNTQLYGQEVLPPISDVQVLYTLKKDAPKLVFLPRRYGS